MDVLTRLPQYGCTFPPRLPKEGWVESNGVTDSFCYRFLNSRCVTINTGPAKYGIGRSNNLLDVHEAVLSDSGSPLLLKLVKPDWGGPAVRPIDWSHINVETVRRVLTWLYVHDYHSPDPVRREVEVESKSEAEEDHAPDSEHVSQVVSDRAEDTHETPPEVWTYNNGTFTVDVSEPDFEYPVEEPVAEEGPAEEPEPLAEEPEVDWVATMQESPERGENKRKGINNRPLTPLGECVKIGPFKRTNKTAIGDFEEREFPHETFSYREALLAHVEVYHFAKDYLLMELQELALQRMMVTLGKLDCSVKHAEEELTEVVGFVYDNISCDQDGQEPMRKLVSQFVAFHFTSLLHGSFEELVGRGGDFGLDLARKLRQRLVAHEVSGVLAKDKFDPHTPPAASPAGEDLDGPAPSAELNNNDAWARFGRAGKKKRR